MSVETIQAWADHNGITHEAACRLAAQGILPTVKLGKRRMVNTAYGQVPTPTAHPGLRLLCVLVPSRDGESRSLPIHTLHPLPPRISAQGKWSLADHPGFHLRETHPTPAPAAVLARNLHHGQTNALRAGARAVHAGGLTV